MASETLKKLAADLREQAAQEERQRMVKCAQVLQAARALVLLQEKVKNHG